MRPHKDLSPICLFELLHGMSPSAQNDEMVRAASLIQSWLQARTTMKRAKVEWGNLLDKDGNPTEAGHFRINQ